VIKFKNFYDFEKTVVQIVKMHIEEIKDRTLDITYLRNYITNNTTVKKLREFHQNVDRL